MAQRKAEYYEVVKAGRSHGVRFVLWGNSSHRTQVFNFFESLNEKKERKPIEAIVGLIDKYFPNWRRIPNTKYKLLEGKIVELKNYQVRIACFWQPKTKTLVGIYGTIKKDDRWSKKDLTNARRYYKQCQDLDFQDT